jgi:multicomponent Na+:H+ antiporter subunit E
VRRALLPLVLLTLTYALALASFKPWDLAIGALLSCVLLVVFRRFVFMDEATDGILSRSLYFLPFVLAVVRSVIAGTWEVALVTLHMRSLTHPGIVAVPIEERSPTGVAVSALATTLSPGTFLVDVDQERGVMLLHVMDASDPEAVRAEHHEFYHRYQKKVFP